MSDADLWENASRAGMPDSAATAFVEARRKATIPADLWEIANRSGLAPDAATLLVQGATGRQPQAQTAAPGIGNTLLDKFEDYATLGLAPKLLGSMSAVYHAIRGDQPAADAYSNTRDVVRGELASESKAHPVASAIGAGAGMLLSPMNDVLPGGTATTLLGKAARGATTGAAAGAISGAARTDADPSGTLGDAAAKYAANIVAGVGAGALGGAAVGGVAMPAISAAARRFLPAVPDAISQLLSRLQGAPGPTLAGATDAVTAPAAAKIAAAMQQAGTTPAEIAAQAPSGSGNMIADALPDFTRTLRSVSASARNAIDPALDARASQQVPAIQSLLEAKLNTSRADMTQATNEIIAQRAAAAKPLYERAYAAPDVTDPSVLAILQRPSFKAAYASAQRTAADEGAAIPNLPTPVDLSKSPELQGAPPEVIAKLQAQVRAQSPQGVPVRAIDLVKREIQDKIQSARQSGALNQARVLQGGLEELLGGVDQAVPAYAAARRSFAGFSALRDAADAGADFLNPKTSAGDITSRLAQMTPSEADLFRQGAMSSIMNKIEAARGSASGRADLVAKFYDSVNGQSKIRALFPDETSFNAFHQALSNLGTQNATRSFVTAGSQTLDKASQAADFLNGISPITALRAASGSPMAQVSLLARAASALRNRGAVQDATSAAPALVAQGPALQRVLAAIQAHQTEAARDAIFRRVAASAAGQALARRTLLDEQDATQGQP